MPGETILVIDDSPTILKVVQLVLSKAGFTITTASDGEQGVTSAREQRPDLILLDFVMPRMNGYQVCRALAGDPELADIPVVLMSAKGDQVGERFVKVMGIVDYITKPFSPEAITAVVQHTVAKYKRRREAGEQLGAAGDPTSSAAPVTGDDPLLAAEQQARDHVLAEVRNAIAEAVSPRIAGLVALAHDAEIDEHAAVSNARVPTDADAISDAARDALDAETLTRILGAVRPGLFPGGDTSPGEHEEPALEGDLRLIPIAEVLQLLQVQSHSGVLNVTRARGRVDVFFRQGRIDFSLGNNLGDEFLIGRFIVGLSLMTKPDLEAFIAGRADASGPHRSGGKEGRPNPPRPLGQQLVKLGYLSETEVKQVITKQTCELVYEILRWNFGRFAFRATRDLPPLAVEAGLGLEVDGILMEGFRRVDEWHLIEREIENFDLVFLRNEDAVAQMGRGRLTREELTILELVNGKNTVKEIIRQSRMGSFDVSKMLYRLLSIKLIRRRVMPVAV